MFVFIINIVISIAVSVRSIDFLFIMQDLCYKQFWPIISKGNLMR